MTHEEQREWMIHRLLDENQELAGYGIPRETQDQKNLLRALMNVRMPDPISEEYLAIQDSYLQEENAREGYTALADLQPCTKDSRLYLWQGDITTLRVDAIVNAANSALLGCFQPLHSCIDKATHIRITHPSSCITASC